MVIIYILIHPISPYWSSNYSYQQNYQLFLKITIAREKLPPR